MYSIDPTSSPRVGWAAMSSLVSRDNSRATISFCWLPPERWPAASKTERSRVRTDRNYLGSDREPLRVIPGMTAQVDVLTGEKTVLAYLMKPILKARDRALTER